MNRSASTKQLLIYGLSGPIIALNLWVVSQLFKYFQNPILILSSAAIVAFLLNYPVRFLERLRLKRPLAVTLVLFLTLALIVILGFTLIPVLNDQTIRLLKSIPSWLDTSQDNLNALEKFAQERRLKLDFQIITQRLNDNIQNLLQQLATGAFGFAGTLLSGIVNFILILVLAFYMLLYGTPVWDGLTRLLPASIRVPFKTSLKLNFHYFFLSQILLALFMTASLTPVFSILGIQFPLPFALIIGVSQLIPFIGATLGIGLVTLILLLQNFWVAFWVAIAAIIIQQVKDNLLAPRLLGEFIGLNPIWIFVAILIGFEIAGLFGTLVAIPIAGTIKSTYDTFKREKAESL